MSTITIPAEMLDNIVQYVEVSSMTAKRAIDEVAEHRQLCKKAEDVREPLLGHMIAAGVVAKNQTQTGREMLGNHFDTMQLLKAAVDKIVELKGQQKTAGDLGRAVDGATYAASGLDKQGEYNSLTDSFIGRRVPFVKESDRPLLALIGK